MRAFWPLWTVLAIGMAALMMGLQDLLAVEIVWGALVLVVIGLLAGLVIGLRRFRFPSRAEAVERVDASLPGRPIAALADTQAIGAGDVASQTVWRAHQARMAERTRAAKVTPGNLRLADRDIFGLRYVALLFLTTAILFGSVLRVGSVTDLGPTATDGLIAGPVWEGWVEPPAYTGKPTLYLADIDPGKLRVPEGSRLTLRLYGEVGALTVAETVSGRVEEIASAAEAHQSFEITQSGTLEIAGPGGVAWDVVVEPDMIPTIQISAPVEADAQGEMAQAFFAMDDYGVVAGTVTIALDLTEVERRHGLSVAPDPRDVIELDLPMPFNGQRDSFEESFVENFSEHPFANLPVVFVFEVEDAIGQIGHTTDIEMILPGKRFFQPMARAVIEQRRDLLWSKSNGRRVSQILRAISHRPNDIFTSETTYLRLRAIERRLATAVEFDTLSDDIQTELSDALWELAIQLEEGSLADARARLERAQERLAEAMRSGASDEEIAELMQELRDATDEYMRQLAQRQEQNGNGTDEPQSAEGDTFEFSQDELQALMDRIEELMQEGRMAEAQELMEQLNELMENLQVAEGQPGGEGSEGEQAMEGLAESLGEQQGLSDQAFRDLQEQFNPNAEAGENDGNVGRNGGRGEGQSHEGQGGDGGGEESGEGDQGGGNEGDADRSLADRQQALREEIERQRNNLPGAGSEAGEAARDALDRAGEAMDGAEEALRNNELAEALDRQAEAMDALREGMQSLGEALARNEEEQNGQGQESGDIAGAQPQQQLDPLGRQAGNEGQLGTGEDLLQGEDVYRRAGQLLEEIRRRSAQPERPEVERDYLRRLLDRF